MTPICANQTNAGGCVAPAAQLAQTQITSAPHSKIINSLFGPECIKMEKAKKSIVSVCKVGKKVFLHFPTACKETLLFLASFELKIVIFFPWCSPDALFSFCGTMTTLEHPAGAPQLGISRIVLDIFGFHQSK